MIGYYEITKAVVEHLQNDVNVNTVLIGNFDQVNLNKVDIFPLAHVMISSAQFPKDNSFIRFGVTVSVMDIVDQTKDSIESVPPGERWKGIDNKQDILNTMLTVIELLSQSFRDGSLSDLDYDIVSPGIAEPFEDRFEHLLTGWSITFTIDVPNTVKGC